MHSKNLASIMKHLKHLFKSVIFIFVIDEIFKPPDFPYKNLYDRSEISPLLSNKWTKLNGNLCSYFLVSYQYVKLIGYFFWQLLRHTHIYWQTQKFFTSTKSLQLTFRQQNSSLFAITCISQKYFFNYFMHWNRSYKSVCVKFIEVYMMYVSINKI